MRKRITLDILAMNKKAVQKGESAAFLSNGYFVSVTPTFFWLVQGYTTARQFSDQWSEKLYRQQRRVEKHRAIKPNDADDVSLWVVLLFDFDFRLPLWFPR